MNWLSRFQTFIASVPARIFGSRMDFRSEYATRLSTAAKFPANGQLLSRQQDAARGLPKNSVKPDRDEGFSANGDYL